MNRRADILIDAIGKVDEKYIERSAPMSGEKINIGEMTEGIIMSETSSGLVEITVPKPDPKQLRNRKIRIAAVSGLAAAVVISGGVFVWNKLGGLKDPFTHGASVTTDNNNNPEQEYVPDVRNLRWGMTVDEVKAHETATLSDTFNREDSTELIYYPVEFEGCDTEMQLNVAKDIGFYNVIYNIRTSEETTGRKEDVYKKLYDLSVGRHGLPDNGDGITWASWYIPEKNTEFEVSLDENTNIVEYWVKWVHDTSSLPVMRGLRWGMTLDEVKENELEFDAAEEEGEDYTGNARTLLTYNEVKYKGYYTKLTLCVEDQNGLTGINYRVDTQAYPDALNTLKADFEKKYGKCKESYGSCEWSMPQVGLTVMLFDYEQTVQVGFYPYFDTSENNPENTSDNTVEGGGDYDETWKDLSTWTQYDPSLRSEIPVYPPAMPGFDEESFDWSEIDEGGYPRVRLSCDFRTDLNGKYDVYLLAENVFADPDNEDILYGTLSVGLSERGSEKLTGMQVISAVYEDYLMKINMNDIEKYLQIFSIEDGSGNTQTLVKYAYGEKEPYYYTTFAYINTDRGQLEAFGNLSGYAGTVDSGSPVVGMGLSGELEQNENEILDNVTGLAFSFDFTKCEVSVRAFTPTNNPAETEQSSDDKSVNDGTKKLKAFDISGHSFISHERNPGEVLPFDSEGDIIVTPDNIAYVQQARWLEADKLLAQAKESLGENHASFEEAVKPYCNADGSLNYEKAVTIAETPTALLFEEPEIFASSWDYRVINDTWLIAFNENDVIVYMSDDKMTAVRKAAVYLWSVYDEYPDMTVTAISDYEKKECYLLVVSEDCPMIHTAMVKNCGNDAAACCRFMTSFDAKADWLPVTMLKQSGDKTYIDYVGNYDQYNVAFDDGIYTGASMGGRDDIIKGMRELLKLEEADKFDKETADMPVTVKDRREFAKVLREHIKSFQQVIPYASIFDPVKLPKYSDTGFSAYYSLGGAILEISAEPGNADYGEYTIMYRLLKPETNENHDLTRIRSVVQYFRDHYLFSDPENGYNGYTIRGIEVIDTGADGYDRMRVRLIADESMWNEIEKVNGVDLRLTEGWLLFASEPTDTGGLTSPEM